MEINTFEKYMKEPYALSIVQMQAIHQELVEEIEKDADAMELYDELVSTVTRYTAIRAGWRDKLGYEEDDKYFRKTIGDFACYIAFVNSLCAR